MTGKDIPVTKQSLASPILHTSFIIYLQCN